MQRICIKVLTHLRFNTTASEFGGKKAFTYTARIILCTAELFSSCHAILLITHNCIDNRTPTSSNPKHSRRSQQQTPTAPYSHSLPTLLSASHQFPPLPRLISACEPAVNGNIFINLAVCGSFKFWSDDRMLTARVE